MTELPTHCREPKRGFLVNQASGWFVPCPCGKRTCEGCGAYKAKRLRRRLAMLQPNWFITFTLETHGEPTAENEAWAKTRIRTFFNWMRRQRWGQGMKMGWVREVGSLGRLHFHAVIRINPRVALLPFSHMQRIARQGLGLGTLDVRKVWRQEGAAHYLAKYVTKDTVIATSLPGRSFAMTPGHNIEPDPDWTWEKISPLAGASWAEPYNYDSTWGALIATMIAGAPSPCSLPWLPSG